MRSKARLAYPYVHVDAVADADRPAHAALGNRDLAFLMIFFKSSLRAV
jgi:hypothetical protein